MSLDFERVLREQAEKVQDENRARLLAGEAVSGEEVPPVKAPGPQPGVKTGALASDLTRRENVTVDATGFAIRPSPEQAVKWSVYNAGREARALQPPRPVSGLATERHQEIAAEVARAARDQIVARLKEQLP